MKGFTLIELMIVVCIVGILAAVALPAYQDYIKHTNGTPIDGQPQTVVGATHIIQGRYHVGDFVKIKRGGRVKDAIVHCIMGQRTLGRTVIIYTQYSIRMVKKYFVMRQNY